MLLENHNEIITNTLLIFNCLILPLKKLMLSAPISIIMDSYHNPNLFLTFSPMKYSLTGLRSRLSGYFGVCLAI